MNHTYALTHLHICMLTNLLCALYGNVINSLSCCLIFSTIYQSIVTKAQSLNHQLSYLAIYISLFIHFICHLFICSWNKASIYFLVYQQTNTPAAKLLYIDLSWCQYSIRTSWSSFQNINTTLPHMEAKWLPFFHDFLHSINATLNFDHTFVLSIPQEKDVHLMDMVLNSKIFTAIEICRINFVVFICKCILYLILPRVVAQGQTN